MSLIDNPEDVIKYMVRGHSLTYTRANNKHMFCIVNYCVNEDYVKHLLTHNLIKIKAAYHNSLVHFEWLKMSNQEFLWHHSLGAFPPSPTYRSSVLFYFMLTKRAWDKL